MVLILTVDFDLRNQEVVDFFISFPDNFGTDQDQQKFENLGSIRNRRSMEPTVREALASLRISFMSSSPNSIYGGFLG